MSNIEVDSEHIIQTLMEENRAINDNRIYLMALIKQIEAEYKADQKAWELEKASLLKDTDSEKE